VVQKEQPEKENRVEEDSRLPTSYQKSTCCDALQEAAQRWL